MVVCGAPRDRMANSSVETAVFSRRKPSRQGPSRCCDWGVSQRAAGWLSVAVCAATEPARFARRRTRRASPRFSSRTESPMSAPLPRRGARKPICLPKIMFVVARVPSTLVPAFPLRAERRMKPGRHETTKSADRCNSPPVVVLGVRSRRVLVWLSKVPGRDRGAGAVPILVAWGQGSHPSHAWFILQGSVGCHQGRSNKG